MIFVVMLNEYFSANIIARQYTDKNVISFVNTTGGAKKRTKLLTYLLRAGCGGWAATAASLWSGSDV